VFTAEKHVIEQPAVYVVNIFVNNSALSRLGFGYLAFKTLILAIPNDFTWKLW